MASPNTDDTQPSADQNGQPKKRRLFAWVLRNGISSASEDALKDASDSAHQWEVFCGWLVAFGLALEVVFAWRHDPFDAWPARWGAVIADGFVLAGVVGEVWFSSWLSSIETQLRLLSDARVEKALGTARIADQHATQAASRAIRVQHQLIEATDRLAKAEKEAAETRERAARAELATAELWASVASRSLSAEQRELFIAAVRGKISLGLKVQSRRSDVEAYPYAQQFLEALRAAGISAEWDAFPEPFFWFNEPGIYVWSSGEAVDDEAETLISALAAAGITANIAHNSEDRQSADARWLSLVVWSREPPEAPRQ